MNLGVLQESKVYITDLGADTRECGTDNLALGSYMRAMYSYPGMELLQESEVQLPGLGAFT